MQNRMNEQTRPDGWPSDAFKDYDDDENNRQSMVVFLSRVWKGAPNDSFLFVATTNPDGSKWREHIVRASKVKADLNRFLRKYSRWDHNLFFGVNPFSRDSRLKKYALPTSLGWCDMDASDPDAYRPQPNLLWETSPDRFQALWLWDARHDVEEAERFSRSLADRHDGDSGWTITKMLRIPGSINHKPHYDEPFVRMISQNFGKVSERPEPTPDKGRHYRHSNQVLEMNPYAYDRRAVLKKYGSRLSTSTRQLIRDRKSYAPNKSNRIFAMIAGLFEASASVDEIASVIWDSPYFLDKYGVDRNALETEVSRIIAKIGGRND